jgi:hypothetical protein
VKLKIALDVLNERLTRTRTTEKMRAVVAQPQLAERTDTTPDNSERRTSKGHGSQNPCPSQDVELHILQSIFSPAARRETRREEANLDRRDGELKMDWTKPTHDVSDYVF